MIYSSSRTKKHKKYLKPVIFNVRFYYDGSPWWDHEVCSTIQSPARKKKNVHYSLTYFMVIWITTNIGKICSIHFLNTEKLNVISMITSWLHCDIFYGEKHNYIKSYPQAIFKHLGKLSSWAKKSLWRNTKFWATKGHPKWCFFLYNLKRKIMEKQRFGSKIFVFCCLQ